MQYDLTASIRALRARMDDLLASRVLSSDEDWAGTIARAAAVQAASDDVMRAVVDDARRGGATWQRIGDALGVSRQAAFQRYGKPIDPRTGEPMDTPALADAAELASAAIDELIAGQWELVADRFDPAMSEALPVDALAAAWTQVIAVSGAYERRGPSRVLRAGDVTTTQTPLAMEAGDYIAHIAFRDDRSIAGLHILEEKNS